MTAPTTRITLRDRLSHLSLEQAVRLLGADGKAILRRSRKFPITLADQTRWDDDRFEVRVKVGPNDWATATVADAPHAKGGIEWRCDRCFGACDHVGLLFSIVLENKVELGLAAPPEEREPVAMLGETALVARALADRAERAKTEPMKIVANDRDTPWTEYVVTSATSGKSHRVFLRGMHPGEASCSCPDFRTNTLGTCKHVMRVIATVKRKFTAEALRAKYRWKQVEVYLEYGAEVRLRVGAPSRLAPDTAAALEPVLDKPSVTPRTLISVLKKLDRLAVAYQVWPDADEFVEQHLHRERLAELTQAMRADPKGHALRKTLLHVPLLPYQVEGVAFAVGAGRSVLADDMGLGKTIQAVGAAELLAREAGIRKVLVVCPASLKSQWRSEIGKFCDRTVQTVDGRVADRTAQYASDAFFTVCNYEQVLRDILAIEKTPWDLIILDEGQRIKNWEAKTSRVIKGLQSRFALVLSGTPLENRLDELYSVVQFIDQRRLGPGFRFFNQHLMVDESGKTLGYRNLDQLRERLRPVILRRTRESVRLELPERTTEIVRIPPTDEQLELHDTHLQIVAQIVSKPYISEMDLLRLRMALLMCRMAANGTFLVTKENPNHSTKLERFASLVEDFVAEENRKVVVFSEWTTMLDLVEPILRQHGAKFVRLDGSVPQRKRHDLVHTFQTDRSCRFFLSTNAGGTGLNLQAGNTLVNLDLPWNPAILDQRIGRIHRMGQNRAVQVFVLVTEKTLEENLLKTLSDKKSLALAALDPDSPVDSLKIDQNSSDLKARLEVLLGAKPPAPEDRTSRAAVEGEVERRQRLGVAGGEMLASVFRFLGELTSGPAKENANPEVVRNLRARLDACVQPDAQGRPQLTVTLPSAASLDDLARSLAAFAQTQ